MWDWKTQWEQTTFDLYAMAFKSFYHIIFNTDLEGSNG